jgi:DNA polymerase III delta subunit
MLYVYHGQDVPKSLEKARALINSLRAKRPDASYIEADADAWSNSVIEENVGGQGLFSNKYIIFLNRVTENADAKEVLPDFIQIMNESSNIFILLEGKLNADLKRAVEKHAERVVETGEEAGSKKQEAGKKEEFNIFALADAVGSRNALKSWGMYRQAIDNGQETEPIVGMIFWKIKSMIVAKNTRSYSEKELAALLKDLITVYHDGHRGIVDMELGIEKRLLNLR